MNWVILSNGGRARRDLVAAVYTHEETNRIFLKNDKGEILCNVQLKTSEAFRKELDEINKQIG